MADISTVVIDNGSGWLKAGLAGAEEPQYVFPSLYGQVRRHRLSPFQLHNQKIIFIGDEIQPTDTSLTITSPFAGQTIYDWDAMQQIWSHAFHRLQLHDHQRVLMSRAPTSTPKEQERTMQTMFETFHVASFTSVISSVLALHSTGHASGLVLDLGESFSHACPVHNHSSLSHAITSLDVGGRSLTDRLTQLLSYTDQIVRPHIARHLKETYAYVAGDWEKEESDAGNDTNLTTRYALPDGSEVVLGRERYQCVEGLFQPWKIGSEGDGIHQIVANAINKCVNEIPSDALYGTIVLTGGTSRLTGLSDRLYRELRQIAPPEIHHINIITPANRHHGVWVGGSILASLPGFENIWVSRQEYEEQGPSIVQRKCRS